LKKPVRRRMRARRTAMAVVIWLTERPSSVAAGAGDEEELLEGVIVTRGSSDAGSVDSADWGGVACCGDEEAEAIVGRVLRQLRREMSVEKVRRSETTALGESDTMLQVQRTDDEMTCDDEEQR
jgi:hypothetical protein